MSKIERGEESDDHIYGMLRLRRMGVESGYLEIEQFLPARACNFLRTHVLSVYWAHAPLFFKFLSYDVILSPTAFGSQLLHALYPFRKPKWVMLDFSVLGLIGEGRTWKQRIMRFLARRADGIIAVDKMEERLLKERFPEKGDSITFIPLSVDAGFSRPGQDIPEKGNIFSPGRDPGRDFKTLFKALEGLDCRLFITTRPWTLKKLQPVPSFVNCVDLTHQEFLHEYDKAQIVIIPLDTRSGLNNAMGGSTVLEAMSMGKAIIATRTPMMSSYITDGVNGILVPEGDADALRRAVVSVLDDPTKRASLGKKAREFAVNECSPDVFTERLFEYFKRIVSA